MKARVASFDGFSGHADRKELGRYVESLTGDITNIYVVHGEEESSLTFAEQLRSSSGRGCGRPRVERDVRGLKNYSYLNLFFNR